MMVAMASREARLAAVRGGAGELEDVYRDHFGSLVRLARLLLDDKESAEEVVQEAFTRTYLAARKMRGPDDALPYVRTAVVNLARSGLRRRRTARNAHLQPVPDAVSAEHETLRDDMRRQVADAVRALPRRQRECVVLRYFSECSTAQTAAALGISEGSVKSNLHRALASLGVVLEDAR